MGERARQASSDPLPSSAAGSSPLRAPRARSALGAPESSGRSRAQQLTGESLWATAGDTRPGPKGKEKKKKIKGAGKKAAHRAPESLPSDLRLQPARRCGRTPPGPRGPPLLSQTHNRTSSPLRPGPPRSCIYKPRAPGAGPERRPGRRASESGVRAGLRGAGARREVARAGAPGDAGGREPGNPSGGVGGGPGVPSQSGGRCHLRE